MPPDPDAWLAEFGRLPLLAQPGDRWLYNSGAHKPLGMTDTRFWTAETDRLATAYDATPEGLTVWDAPDGQWSRQPAFPDGAAGLVSTSDDMLDFGRMLLRGGAPNLSREAVREMTRDQLTAGQRVGGEAFLDDRSWGFCVSVLPNGAYGWDGVLGTSARPVSSRIGLGAA